MKKILVLSLFSSPKINTLVSKIENAYEIEIKNNLDDLIYVLSERFEEYSAVLVDNLSNVLERDRLIKVIEDNNNYVHSIPIITLTESQNRQKEQEILNDLVLAPIEYESSEKVIKKIIEKAISVINSISFEEFSKMLKELPSLIFLKDNKGRYVFCSKYMPHLKYYDDPNFDIKGKTDLDVRKDIENAKEACKIDEEIVRTGIGQSYIIEENLSTGKEYLQLIKEPVKDKEGKVKGIIAIINNVTKQELLKQELRRKSITDELTGLYNRTYCEEFLRNIDRSMYPISIITADCDGLKEINDKYGHQVGDEYIRIAARMLRNVLPNDAALFRTGGDEFLAIIPNTDEKKVKEYIALLKKEESETIIENQRYSISFGSSTVYSHYTSLIDCINASDLEMYKEKRSKKKAKNSNK